MVNTPRKPRIIRETVKDTHTSHWDLDMLSHAELEALLIANNSTKNGAEDGADSAPAAALVANDAYTAKTSNSGKEPGPA